MKINPVKFNQTHQKQQVSFGTKIELSNEFRETIKSKKEAQKILDIIKTASEDGKNFIITIQKEYNCSGRPTPVGEITYKDRNYGAVEPVWYIRSFFSIPARINSIYKKTLKMMAPVVEKQQAKLLLTPQEKSPRQGITVRLI